MGNVLFWFLLGVTQALMFLAGYACALVTCWRVWRRLVRDRPVELMTWMREEVEQEPI